MIRLSGILTLAAVLLFLLSSAPSAKRSAAHDFTGKCESCHLTSPRQGHKSIFTRDIDVLCIECHELAQQNSHPTKMVPSMKVPGAYFLDWQGRLNCATCHDPHAKNTETMLRVQAKGRAFCETCHKGAFLKGGRHVAASGLAHTKTWTPPDHRSFGQILDRVSLDCLVCHEGSVGPAASFSTGNTSLSYKGPGFSHPIGIDYSQAAAKDRQLRAMDDLSPLVSLYEGKVGCASCHNQYSHEGDMLVFSNRGSALCLECHLK